MDLEEVLESPKHHFYIALDERVDYIDDVSLKKDRNSKIYTLRTKKEVGVNEVRSLQEYLLVSSKERMKVVLYAPSISKPAQNALLKITEDMKEEVYLFIVLPIKTEILPTLLSRCILIEKKSRDYSKLFNTFINSDIKERGNIIDEIYKQKDISRNDIILDLTQNLEKYIHKEIRNNEEKEKIEKLKSILKHIDNAHNMGIVNKNTMQALLFV